MKEITARIGGLADMGEAFTQAWKRIDAGDRRDDYAIWFESPAEMFSMLSQKRVELLHALRGMGRVSIYALAKALERDYKNVRQDVLLLEKYGLVERNEGGVFAPYDMIHIDVPLSSEAA